MFWIKIILLYTTCCETNYVPTFEINLKNNKFFELAVGWVVGSTKNDQKFHRITLSIISMDGSWLSELRGIFSVKKHNKDRIWDLQHCEVKSYFQPFQIGKNWSDNN